MKRKKLYLIDPLDIILDVWLDNSFFTDARMSRIRVDLYSRLKDDQ